MLVLLLLLLLHYKPPKLMLRPLILPHDLRRQLGLISLTLYTKAVMHTKTKNNLLAVSLWQTTWRRWRNIYISVLWNEKPESHCFLIQCEGPGDYGWPRGWSQTADTTEGWSSTEIWAEFDNIRITKFMFQLRWLRVWICCMSTTKQHNITGKRPKCYE